MIYGVIAVILGMFVIDLWVTMINDRRKKEPLPSQVEGIFDDTTYQKWLSYSSAHVKTDLIQKSLSTLLIVLLLILGFFGILEQWTSSITSSSMWQQFIFVLVFAILMIVIGLPFRYYRTFMIEQRFGFNRTTKKTFWIDRLKSLILMVVLGGGLFLFVHAMFTRFQNRFWMFTLIVWAFISVIVLVLFALNTRLFVKIFNKLTPLEEGELKTKIEQLASKVGFNIQKISVMNASKRSTKLNAFFSGMGKTKEVVLYDTLVEKMNDDQILAVLAHELGHAIHKDIPRMLIQQIMVIGIYIMLLALLLSNDAFFTAFGLSGIHLAFGLILWFLLIEPVSMLIGILTNHMSRIAEYKADHFAHTLTSKDAIHTALIVLYQQNLANLNPHPLYVAIHYDHPEASKRLEAIMK